MRARNKVFVSSVFKTLEEERAKIITSLLNNDFIPIAMEMFQPEPHSTWTVIERELKDSDYCVLIVTEDFGSQFPGEADSSWTHMEFKLTRKYKIPTLVFKKNPVAADIGDPQKGFIKAVSDLVSVAYWRDARELSSKVADGLNKLRVEHPRPGWVRNFVSLKKDDSTEALVTVCKELHASGEPQDVRIQDTFFAQTDARMWYWLLNSNRIKTRIIFLDPLSTFGELRAGDLNVNPVTRVRIALFSIRIAADWILTDAEPTKVDCKVLFKEARRPNRNEPPSDARQHLISELRETRNKIAQLGTSPQFQIRFYSKSWIYANYSFSKTNVFLCAPLQKIHHVDSPWMNLDAERLDASLVEEAKRFTDQSRTAFDTRWAESAVDPGHEYFFEDGKYTKGELIPHNKLPLEGKWILEGDNVRLDYGWFHRQLVSYTKRSIVDRLLKPNCEIILLVGVCRTGSTLVLNMLSKARPNSVAIYQPIKSGLRWIKSGKAAESVHMNINSDLEQAELLIIKETLGPLDTLECVFNPIQVLLNAGVDARKLRIVFLDREPAYVFRSWQKIWGGKQRPEELFTHFKMALRSLELQETETNFLPNPASYLVYEVLMQAPRTITKSLFNQLGLKFKSKVLNVGVSDFSEDARIAFPCEPDLRPRDLLKTWSRIAKDNQEKAQFSEEQLKQLMDDGLLTHYTRRKILASRIQKASINSFLDPFDLLNL